jgi:hypothetical protein
MNYGLPGWDKLINPIIEAAKENEVRVVQVKEKFGGLRIYLDNAPYWLYDMTDLVERLSYHICERCGEEGKLRTNRVWLKTLCEECNNE